MFKQLDLDAIGTALGKWIEAKFPAYAQATVSQLRTPSAGLSSDTVLFELCLRENGRPRSRKLVLRMAPTEDFVFPEYDISGQFHILQRLAESALPVPAVCWLEEDATPLGAPFYVMEAVDGEAPSDVPPYHGAGLCADASPDQRAAMWWDGVRILASIHDLDWRSLDLPFLGAPADAAAALAAQLDYWERYIAWARTEEPQPHIDAALRWLLDNPPASGRTGLCWGDARLPNMLFRDFKVTAVLDWEMAFLGDPEADLAWWLFLDWHHSDGYDIPRLEGIPGRAETIARYQELRGEKVENLFFYDVFAALRFAAIMIRAVENMKKRGVPLPTPDFGSNNACTRRLAQLLELPPPGTAT